VVALAIVVRVAVPVIVKEVKNEYVYT
jgi:hypothetical protein